MIKQTIAITFATLFSIGIVQTKANASTLHTRYKTLDVMTEKAMPGSNTSQGMTANSKYAYVARQRSGHNSPMYIERINIKTGQVKDLGNRDIGHGNDITYISGYIYVVRHGGTATGNDVNIYSTSNQTLTYKGSLNIKTDRNKNIDPTGIAWDSSHKRMVYAVGNTLYITKNNSPKSTIVKQINGKINNFARYNWAKTKNAAGQGITVDTKRNNIYYIKSYNLNPNGTTNIGNTSYIGSVNLNNAIKNNKITNGTLDAKLSYTSYYSRFEAEGVAVSDNRILFNTNNMQNRQDRKSHMDFIAQLQ